MPEVMQGVSAVVTTGIYCRPGCGARPLAQNVQHFPVAAAAEANGFRACLRCRPYRAPLVVDGPELVCRAVQLILDGALDNGTEASLTDRLGVSSRHLRRIFVAHLGVTPDGLARSARAHFARRLLDDTDLTVTEVAYAAGFGSLRQFNRALRAVFRAAPRELRAKRRRSDRLVADGGLALRLPFEGKLDWPAMCGVFAASAAPGVEHVTGDVYRRTVVIGGDPGVLELCAGGDDHLVLRLHLPHWEELLHIVRRARRIANLDAERSVRVPGAWDAFEVGVRAIAAQRVTNVAANAAVGRLVERLGTPVPGLRQLGLAHTFPQPDVVADADLTGIGLTRPTAGAIHAFAGAVADGSVRLDRSVSLDEFVASVEALDGLDARIAHYLAFRLGEPDAAAISNQPRTTRIEE